MVTSYTAQQAWERDRHVVFTQLHNLLLALRSNPKFSRYNGSVSSVSRQYPHMYTPGADELGLGIDPLICKSPTVTCGDNNNIRREQNNYYSNNKYYYCSQSMENSRRETIDEDSDDNDSNCQDDGMKEGKNRKYSIGSVQSQHSIDNEIIYDDYYTSGEADDDAEARRLIYEYYGCSEGSVNKDNGLSYPIASNIPIASPLADYGSVTVRSADKTEEHPAYNHDITGESDKIIVTDNYYHYIPYNNITANAEWLLKGVQLPYRRYSRLCSRRPTTAKQTYNQQHHQYINREDSYHNIRRNNVSELPLEMLQHPLITAVQTLREKLLLSSTIIDIPQYNDKEGDDFEQSGNKATVHSRDGRRFTPNNVCIVTPEELLFPFCLVVLSEETTEAITVVGLAAFVTFLELQCSFLTPEAIILMSECARNSRSEIVDAQSHEAVLARILHVYVGCCRHTPNGGLIPERHVVALLKSCYSVATHGNPSELLGSIAEQSMNDMVTTVFERIAVRHKQLRKRASKGADPGPNTEKGPITTITGEEILEYVCALIGCNSDYDNISTVEVPGGFTGTKSGVKGKKHHSHRGARPPYHYRHIFGPQKHSHRHNKNRSTTPSSPISSPSSHHHHSNNYYNTAAIQLQGLCLAHTILFLLKEALLADPLCEPLLRVIRTKLCTALLKVGTTGDNVIVLSQLLLITHLVVQFASVEIVPQTLRIIHQLHLVPLQQILIPSYNVNSLEEYRACIYSGKPGGTSTVFLFVVPQGTSESYTTVVHDSHVLSYTYSSTAARLPWGRDNGPSAVLTRRGVIIGVGSDINTLAPILSNTTYAVPSMVSQTVSETHDMLLQSLLEFCAIGGNISNSVEASQGYVGRRKEAILSSSFGFSTFCFVHYDLSLHITNKDTLSSIIKFLVQFVLQTSVTASASVAGVLGQMYSIKCGVGNDNSSLFANKNTLLVDGGPITAIGHGFSVSAPLLYELHLKSLLSLVDGIPSVTDNVLDGIINKSSGVGINNNQNETRSNTLTSFGSCFAETFKNMQNTSPYHCHTGETSDIPFYQPTEQQQCERVTFFPSLYHSRDTNIPQPESLDLVMMKYLKNDIRLNKCYRQERALVFATMIIAAGELNLLSDTNKKEDNISARTREVKTHVIEVLNSTRTDIYRSYAAAARACNKPLPIQTDGAIPSTAKYHQQLLQEQLQGRHSSTVNTSVSLLHSDVLQWDEKGLVAFEALGVLVKGLYRRWCVSKKGLHQNNNNKFTDVECAKVAVVDPLQGHLCHPLHRHITTIAYIKHRLHEFSLPFDNREWKRALTSLLRPDDTSFLESVTLKCGMSNNGRHLHRRKGNCFGLLPAYDFSDTNRQQQDDNTKNNTQRWSTGFQVGQVLYCFRAHLNRQVLGDFIGELGKSPAKPSLNDAVFDQYREYDPVTGENKMVGYKNMDARDALIVKYQTDLLDIIGKTTGRKLTDVTDEEINVLRIKEWERGMENDCHIPYTTKYMAGILKGFLQGFKFHGKTLLSSVREFVFEVGLPGEAQKIDRVMEAFSTLWFQSNTITNKREKDSTEEVMVKNYYDDSTSGDEEDSDKHELESSSMIVYDNQDINPFKGPDAAFILSFSIIMLNTDLHSGKLSKTMKQDEFRSMNRAIDEGGASLPDSYLNEIYDSVYANQIVMSDMFQMKGVVNSSVWDLLERQALAGDKERNGFSQEKRRAEITRILSKISDMDNDPTADCDAISSHNSRGGHMKHRREKYYRKAQSLMCEEFLLSVGFYTPLHSLDTSPTLFSKDDAAAVLDIYVFRTLWPPVIASALSIARTIMAAATGCSSSSISFMNISGSIEAITVTRGTLQFLTTWRDISVDLSRRQKELKELANEKQCNSVGGNPEAVSTAEVRCVSEDDFGEITSSFGTRRLQQMEALIFHKTNSGNNNSVFLCTSLPPSSPFWIALSVTSPKNYCLLVRAITDIYATMETEQELMLLDLERGLTNSCTMATVADRCTSKNHFLQIIGQQHLLPFLRGGSIHNISRYGSIVASASEISDKYQSQYNGNCIYSPILLAAGRDPYFLFWLQIFMDIIVKYCFCYSNGRAIDLLTLDTWLVFAEVVQLLYIHGAWAEAAPTTHVIDDGGECDGNQCGYGRTYSWPLEAARALYPEAYKNVPSGTLHRERSEEVTSDQEVTNDGGWFSGLWGSGSVKSPVLSSKTQETLFSVPTQASAPGQRISVTLRNQEEDEAFSRVYDALPSLEVLMKELPTKLLKGYDINDCTSTTRSPFERMLHAFCLVGAAMDTNSADGVDITTIDKLATTFVEASTAHLIVEIVNTQLIMVNKGGNDEDGCSQPDKERKEYFYDVILRNVVPYLRYTLQQQILYNQEVSTQISVSAITSLIGGLMMIRSIKTSSVQSKDSLAMSAEWSRWIPIIISFVDELTTLLEVKGKGDSQLLAVAVPLGEVLLKLLPLANLAVCSDLSEWEIGEESDYCSPNSLWDKLLHTARVVALVGSPSVSAAHSNPSNHSAVGNALIWSLRVIMAMMEQLAEPFSVLQGLEGIGVGITRDTSLSAITLRAEEISNKVEILAVSLTEVSCSSLVLTMTNNEPQTTLNELNHICTVSVPSVLYRAEQLLLYLVEVEMNRDRNENNSMTDDGYVCHWFPTAWLTVVNSLASIVTTIILGNSSNFVSHKQNNVVNITGGEAHSSTRSDRLSEAGGIIVTLQRCCALPFSLNTSKASIYSVLLKTMIMTHMRVPNSVATTSRSTPPSTHCIGQQHAPCPPVEHLFNKILLPLVESICCSNSMNLLLANEESNESQGFDSVDNSKDHPQRPMHSFGSYLLPSVILSTVFGPMAGPENRPTVVANATHESSSNKTGLQTNKNRDDGDDDEDDDGNNTSNTTTLQCGAISLLCRTYLECLIMLISGGELIGVTSSNHKGSTFPLSLFSGGSYKDPSSPDWGPNTPHVVSTNTVISLWKSIVGLLYAIYTADDDVVDGAPSGDQQQNSVVLQEAIEASITNVMSTVRMVIESQPSSGPAASIVQMFWQVSGVLLTPFPFYSARMASTDLRETGNPRDIAMELRECHIMERQSGTSASENSKT